MTLPASDLTPCPVAPPGADVRAGDATRVLALGIGCRRGVSLAQIDSAVAAALGRHDLRDVNCVATLSDKLDEAALVAFCARHGLPLLGFGRDAIAATMEHDPALTHSAAAQRHVQLGGVCELCALLALPGSVLVVRKQVLDGVTVAVASNAASNAESNAAPNAESSAESSAASNASSSAAATTTASLSGSPHDPTHTESTRGQHEDR